MKKFDFRALKEIHEHPIIQSDDFDSKVFNTKFSTNVGCGEELSEAIVL